MSSNISDLNYIRQKVRRITRRMSEAQLTTIQLDKYINRYVMYDFPETLRLFNLRTTFEFYTLPFIDTYSTTDNVNSPLYDFTNKYITTDSPVYIAGLQASFSESRTQFYNVYPKIAAINSTSYYGNGVDLTYPGQINTLQQSSFPLALNQYTPLLQKNVLFSSIDTNNNGLAMADSPILDATSGNYTNYGLLYNALTTNASNIPVLRLPAPYFGQSSFPSSNFINYLTGEFVVTFDQAPQAGVPITTESVQTNPSIPRSLLFFDGEFVVRPVPDQSYKVQMEVFIQPTELLQGTQTPELNEWADLIAWNAAKKVYEDNSDYDSIQQIMPSLKEQEDLVNRRTIVQISSQAVPTIYGARAGLPWSNSWGYGKF